MNSLGLYELFFFDSEVYGKEVNTDNQKGNTKTEKGELR